MAGVLDFIRFFLRHPLWTITNAKVVFRYWARRTDRSSIALVINVFINRPITTIRIQEYAKNPDAKF
jgi:hypothetical protein